MKSGILLKRNIFIILLGGLVFFGIFFLSLISKSTIQDNSILLVENIDALSNQEYVDTELPVRLKILRINMDFDIISVGLTPDGAMDVSKNPTELAWFSSGPRPGEDGSAVIAGHYGWKNNVPAAFDDLHTLHIGDQIIVEDERGVETTFVVREMKTYNRNESVPGLFSSNDGEAHLNLITCSGTWDKTAKTFSDRLVVFTDKK